MSKMEVALSVDALVTATRAYLERSIRELFAKGPSSAASEDGAGTLQEQLATLGSWHSWLLGHLRHFKASKGLPCGMTRPPWNVLPPLQGLLRTGAASNAGLVRRLADVGVLQSRFRGSTAVLMGTADNCSPAVGLEKCCMQTCPSASLVRACSGVHVCQADSGVECCRASSEGAQPR